MPSTSKKQHGFMGKIATDPKFAKEKGIPQSVGEHFLKADKGKKFGTGGDVNYTYGGKGQINKQRTRGGSIFGYEKNVPNINLNKYEGKKEGGKIMATKEMKKLFKGKESVKEELAEAKAIKSGKITPMEYAKGEKMEGHRKGGMCKMARGGGVEIKGKTKGKFIKMKGC